MSFILFMYYYYYFIFTYILYGTAYFTLFALIILSVVFDTGLVWNALMFFFFSVCMNKKKNCIWKFKIFGRSL